MAYSRNEDGYVGLRRVTASGEPVESMMDILERNFQNGLIDDKTYDQEMDALIALSETRR